jgi:hypothetical protein
LPATTSAVGHGLPWRWLASHGRSTFHCWKSVPRTHYWQLNPSFRTNPSGTWDGGFVPATVVSTRSKSALIWPRRRRLQAAVGIMSRSFFRGASVMSSEPSDENQLAELLALPYSVATQSRIAKLLNKDGDDPTHIFAPEEHFEGIMMLLSFAVSNPKCNRAA